MDNENFSVMNEEVFKSKRKPTGENLKTERKKEGRKNDLIDIER